MAPAIPHSDLTYRIIGAAMRVHNRLGPGHKEAVYQRALMQELLEAELAVQAEQPSELCDGERFLGLLYLDLLVEDKVIVETKAFAHLLTREEIAQVITYLAATGLPVGLLLNFGRQKLEYKRILPPRKLEGWQERIGRYLWQPKGSVNG
jgi:GxxExxY protein